MRIQPTDEGRLPARQGDPGARVADAAPRRGGPLRLRNWRVPQRLLALIVLPTVAAVVLGGLRIHAAVSDSSTYGKVEKLARLGTEITALVHETGYERDLTAGYIALQRAPSAESRLADQHARVNGASSRVRALAGDIDSSFGVAAADNARDVLARLDGYGSLREAAKTKVPAVTIVEKYSETIAELIDFLDVIAQGSADEDIAETTRALAALTRSKEQASRERGILYAGLAEGALDLQELVAFNDARGQESSALTSFRTAATPEQAQLFDDTVVGPDVDQSRSIRQRALVLGGGGPNGRKLDVVEGETKDHEIWLDSQSGTINRMRQVEQRLGADLLSAADDRRGAARWNAVQDSAIVAFVLLFVLLLTFVMARSLVRPLRRLRDGALDIAGARLPGLVERLRDPQAAATGIEVEPIDIDSTDEIGQVARAFDEVHREAVRLAADEAVLRGNINAMFVNLSRRSQSLIERQLRLIDELEQGEQDEERLASLFRLDHLATRMRRNCENLLVLGGQEQVRRWNQPVPLIDIVRASLSEVEQYDRVGLRVQGDVAVVGPVVNDLVHLAAELVENATAFSPEHTKVTVSGHLLSGGGAMLQITDNGVGMSPEELESANWRLANPPVIDFSAARRMGLFVVGRLAVRHGIRVELRPALSGGITAFVLLPAVLIARGDEAGAGVTPRRFDPSQETESAWAPAPVNAAAAPPLGAGPSLGQLAAPDHMMPGPVPPVPEPVMRETGPQPMLGGTGPLPAVSPMPAMGTGPQYMPPMQEVPGHAGMGQGSGGHSLPKRQPGVAAAPARPGGPMVPPQGPQRTQPSLLASIPGFPSPGERGTTGGFRRPAAAALGEDFGVSWGWAEEPPNGTPPAERSPIFDAMESEWFQRRTARGGARLSDSWKSPGDAGWQAAEAVREPAASGTTKAGLPKRVPGRNRVPGAAQPAAAASGPQPQQPAAPAPPPQSADVIRNRFASLQRGVHRGRTEIRTDGAPDVPDDSRPPGSGGPGDTERGAS